jgi:EF-hand domain pair
MRLISRHSVAVFIVSWAATKRRRRALALLLTKYKSINTKKYQITCWFIYFLFFIIIIIIIIVSSFHFVSFHFVSFHFVSFRFISFRIDSTNIFKLFDRDGSGTIDIQEMRAVLNELGKKVDNKELEKLMNDLDNDGSGEIDFEEFLKGMERLDQLTAAPDVFQTGDDDPVKSETIVKLQEDVKELKKQSRAWQTVFSSNTAFALANEFSIEMSSI